MSSNLLKGGYFNGYSSEKVTIDNNEIIKKRLEQLRKISSTESSTNPGHSQAGFVEGLNPKEVSLLAEDMELIKSDDVALISDGNYDMSDSDMKKKMNLDYGTVAINLDGTKVGIKVPKGTLIEEFYPYCKWFGECVEGDLCFDKYLLYKQTHTLDSKEMSQLIRGVVLECKDVGIETLTDEEIKSMMENYEKKENKNE